MKKTILLIAGLYFVSTIVLSQPHTTKYLEVPARFDAVGNIAMSIVPEQAKHGADTTLDNKAINRLISKGRSAQKVINLLAAEGWQLLFVLPTDKGAGRNALAPDLFYYFRRE